MNTLYAGLDFGTSNSTIGTVRNGKPALVPVEDIKVTIPSAIFFSFEEEATFFGRKAISEYVDGAEGRLMRALKSVLGTSLIHDTTRVKGRQMAFTEIIGVFIAHLKAQAEREMGEDISHVVMGRPVQFVDDKPDEDREAQNQLEKAARAQGFKHIAFQFEPIAAALDYEQQVKEEQLAFIVDIGGGTSDFSIVRVSPERAKAIDRKDDILANEGVHIGGTDFDRLFSMAKVMPFFGKGSKSREKGHELPAGYYHDLATWQRINWLYTKKTMINLRQIRYEAAQPELVDRLIAIIESRQGHALAGKVEEAKILLTEKDATEINLHVLDGHINVPVTRGEFEDAIAGAVERVTNTVTKTLNQANLRPDQVQALFLTGGSTQIPFVKQSILNMFPTANVVEGDMFGSVGLGLTLDAKRKFG
ncbi:MAG: Hsp70 family protein [Bacteroidetes bacterium]|nr:Hsp70 family protein [Bacteroidota bacterium]